MPAAHVITLPGANRYVFLSNEADLSREIRFFLASLHWLFGNGFPGRSVAISHCARPCDALVIAWLANAMPGTEDPLRNSTSFCRSNHASASGQM